MIQHLDHVGIMVSDMEKSITFYVTVLGLEVRRRNRINEDVELVFLSHPNQVDMEVELVSAPGWDTDGVVNHLAFRVKDIESSVKELEKHGVELEGEIVELFPGTKIAFFRGPDEEKLEFVEKTY